MKHLNQVLLHQNSKVLNLKSWLENIGGKGLQNALDAPDTIISLIKEAGLRGLGGSGFPTYFKWEAIANQNNSREKYLICNGNEDEPGTFKDRLLLEKTPHQLIEGAMIIAVATNVNRIIFYINPDLTQAIENMRNAVKRWEECELYFKVSDKIQQPLEFSILPASGHYIGGEETAAIETVEKKFPFPRRKPPFPAEYGVHGCPTLINNVETICNVSHILRNGVKWYHDLGIGDAYGTKIYSLSGDILSPGTYELPMGISLSKLINNYGGGMLLNKKLKAVFTGGPSNTLLTPKDLDVSLDFDSVAARRSSLGTGAMIIVSEGTGIVKRVAEYVDFFAHSSCGQCPPCKSGTYYIAMLLNKIDTGQARKSDLRALENLCDILPGSGRCALINGAVKVLESSLYHFRDEYEQALKK
ncbi:MAG: SLBB domain-containing protein [Proteobacteria bacterium]|nr:SLBB domain-containing protein [Pseudomonadota bacterium]